MYKKLLLLPLLLFVEDSLFANVSNQKAKPHASLHLGIKKSLKDQNVERIRSFLEQADNWSCGLRCAFHAIAIEKALKNPSKFESTLKQNLQNSKLLKKLDSKYCHNFGLCYDTICKIAHDNNIGQKLICLNIDDNNGIQYEGNISYPLGATLPQIEHIQQQKLNSKLHELVKNAKKSSHASYFVSAIPGHWILFALVNLPKRPAKLFYIDSENWEINNYEKAYVKFLLPHLKQINKGKNTELKPAIAAHLAKKVHKVGHKIKHKIKKQHAKHKPKHSKQKEHK